MRLENDNTPKGLNSKIRQEIGLNIRSDSNRALFFTLNYERKTDILTKLNIIA